MTWYLFIRRDNGDIVSEGSTDPGVDTTVYEVRDVGERPDWTVKAWNPTTRQITDRPVPIIIDRLDDIQARFLADPDFAAVWATLNATRRTQLRTGIQRVLAAVLRDLRWRQEGDAVEVG